VNWGAPLWPDLGLGVQIGYEAAQSDLAGTANSSGSRNQSFLTVAAFHRAFRGESWEYGLAFDWLHDDFFETYDVAQLRGEVGWLWDCSNEIGFWFGVGAKRAGSEIFSGEHYQALDQYNFFYEHDFCRGGAVRASAGWVGGSITRGGGGGGIIGIDAEAPIGCSWALQGGFNYVIVGDNHGRGFVDETWNLGCNLVWYFGGNARCTGEYRPMFNVADNGSFMTTLR
jgi:hypothetical protein